MGGRPHPRTEAPGAETPEKRLAIYSIDDSVENSIGVGYTLGQKLLVQKEFNDSVENSMGGRPYPRTEAPGAETLDDSRENSRGEAIP